MSKTPVFWAGNFLLGGCLCQTPEFMFCYFWSAVHLSSIVRSLCMWFLCSASKRFNFIIFRLRINCFSFAIASHGEEVKLAIDWNVYNNLYQNNFLKIFDSVSVNFFIKILSFQTAKFRPEFVKIVLHTQTFVQISSHFPIAHIYNHLRACFEVFKPVSFMFLNFF